MSLLLVLIGIALIGLTAYDMIMTTLVMNGGGGPITGRISAWLWKRALRRHERTPIHRQLSYVVWIMLLLVITLWALILLTGWTLIFSAYQDAVVNSHTGEPAGFWVRVYYAGFALTTLGVGDYSPQGTAWRLATVLAAANGFSALTLSVTYLIPIVSAGIQKRELALSVSGLGLTPQQLLVRAWRNNSFEAFTPHATSLASLLTPYAERHLAYPALHYFHSEDPSRADAIAVAKLDEVLTILEHGIDLENPLDPLTFHSLRRSITTYLSNLQASYISPADQVPSPPSLAELRAAGVPVVSGEAFEKALEQFTRRRSLLLALVKHSGWSWDAVYHRGDTKGELEE